VESKKKIGEINPKKHENTNGLPRQYLPVAAGGGNNAAPGN
jgi:hypothetical protein